MKKYKILIVDDVKINRKILANIVCDEYEVVEAEDGQEALAVLAKHPDTSLILLDICMPVMNGFEFMKKIKEKFLLKEIPIIVITSEYTMENESKAFQLGAKDFIAKPYDEQVVSLRIKRVIDRMQP